jgi:hypothetical protein
MDKGARHITRKPRRGRVRGRVAAGLRRIHLGRELCHNADMRKSSLELIVQGLNEAGVRYLIVGGLAVNAHGYFRATVDVDLILQLDPANVLAAVAVLKGLGYTPRVPVPIEAFADASQRQAWISEKHMLVFSLHSEQHRETEIDLFVNDPLGFDRAYGECLRVEIAPALTATVCSLADLLKLKRDANRDKDRLDIQKLLELHEKP